MLKRSFTTQIIVTTRYSEQQETQHYKLIFMKIKQEKN